MKRNPPLLLTPLMLLNKSHWFFRQSQRLRENQSSECQWQRRTNLLILNSATKLKQLKKISVFFSYLIFQSQREGRRRRRGSPRPPCPGRSPHHSAATGTIGIKTAVTIFFLWSEEGKLFKVFNLYSYLLFLTRLTVILSVVAAGNQQTKNHSSLSIQFSLPVSAREKIREDFFCSF